MAIRNHRLDGVRYEKARTVGAEITPTIIVVHDTASRLKKFAAAKYLRDNKRKVSVQFVIERDGTITQQVPTNRRANHAGKSHYHGRKHCNNFSIGIEIVNPGRMTKLANGCAKTWYGEHFNVDINDIHEVKTPEHGNGMWMGYTEQQIASVIKICEACFDKYPSLIDVVAHWYISPGRKTDTNPLFPLDQIRSHILGREELSEDHADEAIESEFAPDSMTTIDVPGSSLNLRRWPSFNPNVIASIPHGAIVPVLASGRYDGREWVKVVFNGQTGWVVAQYTSDNEAK